MRIWELTITISLGWTLGLSGIQVLLAVRSMSSMVLLITLLVFYFNTFIFIIEIFFEGLEKKHYKCFLGPKSTLPMLYIDDCINGTVNPNALNSIGSILKGRFKQT
jgi:hypothetical protein